MIKYILKHKIFVAILLMGCGFVSCNDVDDIIDPNYDRLFSPTNLEARVVNKVNVRLQWTENKQAESYNVEVYEGEDENNLGSPVKSFNGITTIPFLVERLEGETAYIARVQAIGNDINESKWTNVAFKTDAEQIFYAVDPDDLEANQVTLRWPAGETATMIVVTPGDIEYAITADDITAGAATITGLIGETNYVAVMKNGSKTRGEVKFTTPIDLGGAIAVTPEDDLTLLLEAANDGDVFALFPGEYVINGNLPIAKTIGIKAVKPANRPVIKGAIFRITQNAGYELQDLVLDGTDSSGDQTIVYNEDQTTPYGAASIINCEILNYVKGIFYVNKKAHISSVTIQKCYIHDVECNGGDFIDFRTGIAEKFTFTNNTVDNCAWERDFFRMDSGGSTNFPDVTSEITITNNTLNKVSNSASKRLLYIRLGEKGLITFSRNVLSNTLGYYTNQSTTNIVAMEKNNYFNAAGFYSSEVSKAYNDAAGNYTTLDPGYTDGFTITNEDMIYGNIGNIPN